MAVGRRDCDSVVLIMAVQPGYDFGNVGGFVDGLSGMGRPVVPGFEFGDFATGLAEGYEDGFADGVASVTATGGTILQITRPPIGRWDPVVTSIDIEGNLYVLYQSGTNHFAVRNPSLITESNPGGFTPLFAERSTIVGDVASIIPNGGWWSASFSLTFVAGVELEEE